MNWWRAGGAVGLGLLASKGAATAAVASGPGKAMARTTTAKRAVLEKSDHIMMLTGSGSPIPIRNFEGETSAGDWICGCRPVLVLSLQEEDRIRGGSSHRWSLGGGLERCKWEDVGENTKWRALVTIFGCFGCPHRGLGSSG